MEWERELSRLSSWDPTRRARAPAATAPTGARRRGGVSSGSRTLSLFAASSVRKRPERVRTEGHLERLALDEGQVLHVKAPADVPADLRADSSGHGSA